MFLESNGRISRCGDFESELIERLIEVQDESRIYLKVVSTSQRLMVLADCFGMDRPQKRRIEEFLLK